MWRWFTVSKVDDGIGQVGVTASEWLGGDVDGTCFAVDTVARERSFWGGEGP